MVDHLSKEQKQEFEEAFDLYDRDYSGTISKNELNSVLRTLGQQHSEKELEEMFEAVDKDGSNAIDLKEFLDMMALTVKEKNSEEELILAFKVFDFENDGYITVAQLRHILSDIKIFDGKITDEEVEELIREVDEAGQVNYEEFVKTMNSRWMGTSRHPSTGQGFD